MIIHFKIFPLGDENMASSRKIWMETNDAKKAYENLRNKSSIEGKLFGGLAVNNENDLVNALNFVSGRHFSCCLKSCINCF